MGEMRFIFFKMISTFISQRKIVILRVEYGQKQNHEANLVLKRWCKGAIWTAVVLRTSWRWIYLFIYLQENLRISIKGPPYLTTWTFWNDFERNITALHYIEVLEYSPKSDNFIFRRGLGPFTECLQIHLVLLDGEGCPNQISHLICSLFFLKVHFYPKFPLEDNESC